METICANLIVGPNIASNEAETFSWWFDGTSRSICQHSHTIPARCPPVPVPCYGDLSLALVRSRNHLAPSNIASGDFQNQTNVGCFHHHDPSLATVGMYIINHMGNPDQVLSEKTIRYLPGNQIWLGLPGPGEKQQTWAELGQYSLTSWCKCLHYVPHHP